MGHSISAYKLPEDERQVHMDIFTSTCDRVEPLSDEADLAYADYLNAVEVASLSRAAGNPLAAIIYMALDREDLNAGCSGSGEVVEFRNDEIWAAIKWCIDAQVSGVETLNRPRNMVDDLAVAICGKELPKGVREGDNLGREIQFLVRCYEWMMKNGMDRIDISFS